MLEEHKKRINKKRLAVAFVVLSLMSVLLVATPQAKGAQFYIASWSYPDTYGQGIYSIHAQSNRTGSWVTYDTRAYDEAASPINWNVSQAIRLLVWTVVNSTLLGISTISQGFNFLKHNVSVTDQFGAEVFSQQNFTYYQNITDSEMFWYQYYVVLDFSPLEGELYAVSVVFEIYY